MIQIKEFNVTCLNEHARVLWCDVSNEALVIDPGAESNEIIQFINQNSLNLKYILLTHSHFDHCGGVAFLKKHFNNVCLCAHRAERNLRENVVDMMAFVGIQENACKACPEPEHYFEDNEVLLLGKEKFVVLFTPGHSAGGVSFYNEARKMVFSGDTLFAGSIGRTDFIGGDYKTIMKSIKERLFVLPDDTCVYTGHGANTTIGHEKKYNEYFI